jgi:adenylylsulfate kinase
VKTALFIGRFQPFHDGHAAVIERLLTEGKAVCVAIRDTEVGGENPYSAAQRVGMIRKRFGAERRVSVIVVPDISEVVYGRDVGYVIRKMDMPSEVEAISASKIRARAQCS